MNKDLEVRLYAPQMSIYSNISKCYQSIPNQYAETMSIMPPIHIIQVGAGGTGGYTAAKLLRFIGNNTFMTILLIFCVFDKKRTVCCGAVTETYGLIQLQSGFYCLKKLGKLLICRNFRIIRFDFFGTLEEKARL